MWPLIIQSLQMFLCGWGLSFLRPPYSLSVPVVDLIDVPKDHFIFSFHVVRNSFLLHALHEALQKHTNLFVIQFPPADPCWVRKPHLHHNAQVSNVVLLCLDELIQNKPEQIKASLTD